MSLEMPLFHVGDASRFTLPCYTNHISCIVKLGSTECVERQTTDHKPTNQHATRTPTHHHEPTFDMIAVPTTIEDDDDVDLHDVDDHHRPPALSSVVPTTAPSRRTPPSQIEHHHDPIQRRRRVALLQSLGCGQLIALIVTSMNTSSYLLIAKQEVHTNFFQLFFVYGMLVLLNRNYHHHHHDNTPDTENDHSDGCVPIDNDHPIHDHDDHHVTTNSTMIASSSSFRPSPYQCLHLPTPISLNQEQRASFVVHSTSIPCFNRWNFGGGSNRRWTALQLQIPIHYYIVISIMDIGSNVLSIYSFHYTTLTSTTLLGSLSIPSTMFFARFLLRRVFTPIQYLGILLCIMGGCYTIYIDSMSSSSNSNIVDNNNITLTTWDPTLVEDDMSLPPEQQQYLGDIMAMTAAVLYGLGDCVAEYLIKYRNRQEYLYMMGGCGMIFTMILIPILEYNAVSEIFVISTMDDATTTTTGGYDTDDSSANIVHYVKIISLFVWFIASVTLYYMMEAVFLLYYDATLLNLSMQSVNLWAYVIMYLINPDGTPSSNFFLALLLVVTGVCLYEMGSFTLSHPHVPVAHDDDSVVGDSAIGSRLVHDGALVRKPRRDSEVEIVHGPNEPAPVNYQSLPSMT